MKTLYEKIDMIHSPYEAFYMHNYGPETHIEAHWHYFIELLYMDQGTVTVSCDNQEYHAQKGDLLFFHAGAIHAIYNASPDMLYSIIKLNLTSLPASAGRLNLAAMIRSARGDNHAPILIHKNSFSDIPIAAWFHRCIDELEKQVYGFEVCFYATVTNILLEVIRYWYSLGLPSEVLLPKVNEPGTIETITEYIDEHSEQLIRIETLAKMCGMSYSYFARNFKDLYGRSCKDYLEFVRINKVKNLLMYTRLDLNYISQETGFSDCSHLIRVFKKLEGLTPKQYRLIHQSDKK